MIQLTPEQIADLERVADAATDGPWETECLGLPGSDFSIVEQEHMRTVAHSSEDDARFIATFDPTTVKMLLARVRELGDKNSHLRSAELRAAAACREDSDRYFLTLNKISDERDQLRARVKGLESALEKIANPFIATKGGIANRIAQTALDDEDWTS